MRPEVSARARGAAPAGVALAIALVLAACGPAEQAAPAAAPAPPPAAEPADAPPLDATPVVVADTTKVDARIVEVALSDRSEDGKLTGESTDRFARDDAVYAAIRTVGSRGGYTLSAKWTGPDGAVLTEYGQVVPAAGAAETLFSLSRPDGWPPGDYTIALAINGAPMRDVRFSVE